MSTLSFIPAAEDRYFSPLGVEGDRLVGVYVNFRSDGSFFGASRVEFPYKAIQEAGFGENHYFRVRSIGSRQLELTALNSNDPQQKGLIDQMRRAAVTFRVLENCS